MARLFMAFFALLSVSTFANPPSFETIPDEEKVISPLLVLGTEAGLKKSFVEIEKKIGELTKAGTDPKGVVKAVRDAHPQAHGCVRASFSVLSDKDLNVNKETLEKLRQGFFAEAKSYKAYIRFSNGSGQLQPDYIPDGRGMAIKVMGVEGPRIKLEKTNELHTQDFLMINHSQFFVKDVKDYAAFFQDKGKFMASHPTEAGIATKIAMQITTSPIESRYFSMTPVLYGKNAVKYSARPCAVTQSFDSIGDLDLKPLIKVLKDLKAPGDIAAHVKDLSPTYDRYLRKALKNGLAQASACFDFYVQFQENKDKDKVTEPIEDPTVEWKTKMYRVARLNIPKQDFTVGRQDEFCENIALTPWHSRVEHQPLGGVQRVRLPIYESISQLRREFNLKHKLTTADLLAEPTGNEVF